MSKTTSVITRVDPVVKDRAESVLKELGISMATAMEIYLRQIAYQRKIPFELAIPVNAPVSIDSLSE